jgi:acetylornithine deacetylase/succinyl-diaminopimelate desuccinylase family protein
MAVEPRNVDYSEIDQDARQRVLEAVEARRDFVIRLTSELVQIRSVTPTYPGVDYDEELGGERSLNLHLEGVERGLGAKTELVEALGGDAIQTERGEQREGRTNLVGTISGEGNGRSLILTGHIDTVPTGPTELWKSGHPHSGKVAEGRIWGRGSTDMKSGVAAMVTAMAALKDAGIRLASDVQLQTTVGEEIGEGATIGARYVWDQGYKADGVICSEPSYPLYRLGLTICSGGVTWLVIKIRGKTVHSCMSYQLVRAGKKGSKIGVNAFERAQKVIAALKELEHEWGFTHIDQEGLAPIGFAAMNLGVVHAKPVGVEVPFIIPDECELGYAIWRNPDDSYEDVVHEIEDAVRRSVDTDPWLRDNPPTLEWRFDWPPFAISRDHPLTQACHYAYTEAFEQEPRYQSFQPVSDNTWYMHAGAPAILIGPGNFEVAHAYDEWVEIEEIVDAVKVYALAAMSWCGYTS